MVSIEFSNDPIALEGRKTAGQRLHRGLESAPHNESAVRSTMASSSLLTPNSVRKMPDATWKMGGRGAHRCTEAHDELPGWHWSVVNDHQNQKVLLQFCHPIRPEIQPRVDRIDASVLQGDTESIPSWWLHSWEVRKMLTYVDRWPSPGLFTQRLESHARLVYPKIVGQAQAGRLQMAVNGCKLLGLFTITRPKCIRSFEMSS